VVRNALSKGRIIQGKGCIVQGTQNPGDHPGTHRSWIQHPVTFFLSAADVLFVMQSLLLLHASVMWLGQIDEK
jgi:hypothetical protein